MLLIIPMSHLCVCVCVCVRQYVCVIILMHVYNVCPSWAGQINNGWNGGGA